LHQKKACSPVFKELASKFPAEQEHFELEMLEKKTKVKVLTLEEKMLEASRPLYLRRYE
jgi:hypothetical protein